MEHRSEEPKSPGKEEKKCQLLQQQRRMGSCLVSRGEERDLACRLTLREEKGQAERLITSIHLSRPENYLSIYQSGCNFTCRKCHSWNFSQVADGRWYSPEQVTRICQEYEKEVTLIEPREKATSWHAHDSCRCCGCCVMKGQRASGCPGVLEPEQVLLSPQGWGPARNIVAFTGGDLTCRPLFYACCARLIKDKTNLWVLIETNGYGLTPENLRLLKDSGVDSFWLDIKAYHDEVHRWLTGCSNEEVLKLPALLREMGFVLEVLSLYIPGVVESDQLRLIARLLAEVDADIPFTILAFFPQYQMKSYRPPNVEEIVRAYEEVKAEGLRKIRLGNIGVFARREEDFQLLEEKVDPEAF